MRVLAGGISVYYFQVWTMEVEIVGEGDGGISGNMDEKERNWFEVQQRGGGVWV
jgi:hypothetical protein